MVFIICVVSHDNYRNDLCRLNSFILSFPIIDLIVRVSFSLISIWIQHNLFAPQRKESFNTAWKSCTAKFWVICFCSWWLWIHLRYSLEYIHAKHYQSHKMIRTSCFIIWSMHPLLLPPRLLPTRRILTAWRNDLGTNTLEKRWCMTRDLTVVHQSMCWQEPHS